MPKKKTNAGRSRAKKPAARPTRKSRPVPKTVPRKARPARGAAAAPAAELAVQPHGAWIHRIARLRSDYLEALAAAHIPRIYVKVFDSISTPMFWSFQCTSKVVKSFTNEGIEVWGWGYHRGEANAAAQASAVRRAIAAGIQGYVVDVEVETEDPETHPNVTALLRDLRDIVPAGNLGYTSFGWASKHPDVPWKTLDEESDLAFPQIYFEARSGDPNDSAHVQGLINDAFDDIRQLGLTKPVSPVFSSESGLAAAQTLQLFVDAYSGSSLWRLPDFGSPGHAWEIDYT
ncbi:MAG: hypothetical protein ACHQPI_08645 [Thermoanaerobaculia bacterium]